MWLDRTGQCPSHHGSSGLSVVGVWVVVARREAERKDGVAHLIPQVLQMNIQRAQKAGNQQLDFGVRLSSDNSPTLACMTRQEKALTYLYNTMNREIESKALQA